MRSERPGASAISPTCVRRRATRRSGAAPIPMTPTVATSPSRRAFIAWVVEKATSAIAARSSPRSSSSRPRASTTPWVTPVSARRAWSGPPPGRAARSPSGSSATAFVKVPPTSTPTRSPVRSRRGGVHGLRAASSRAARPPPPARRATLARRPDREDPDRADDVDGETATPGPRCPSTVGWIPVSSARKIGSRAQSPSIGVAPITSADCSERTALPANATDSRSRIDAPVISSGLIGSFLPELEDRVADARRAPRRRPRRRGRPRASAPRRTG